LQKDFYTELTQATWAWMQYYYSRIIVSIVGLKKCTSQKPDRILKKEMCMVFWRIKKLNMSLE